MKRETTMNIIWTAIATSIMGVMAWLLLSVITLQSHIAAENAEDELRQDVTDVLNDVDKRLAIIEALMVRGHVLPQQPQEEPPIPVAPMMVPDIFGPEEAAPEPPAQMQQQQQEEFHPKYDLRQSKDH